MKTFFLKLFMVFSLFFPAFWSTFSEDYKMEYYAVFTAAYGALLLWMAACAIKGGWKKKQVFALCLAGGLLIYNILSLWFNVRELHWFGEQIDDTVAFLFLLVLCMQEEPLGEKPENLIRFFLGCAVVSNLLSIVYFFAGYTSFLICNNRFYFGQLPADYYEFRHYWLYSHKSDYALMLTLFLAAVVHFRGLFRRKWMFFGSVAVLLTAMFLSHSWTGFGAAALVLLGGFLDQVDWKRFHFRKIHLLGIVGVAAVGGVAGKLLLKERNIFSMGDRNQIWVGALREIRQCPGGWGFQFGERLFEVRSGWSTNNCHNIFLNAMLRFSVPVGLCFLLLMLAVLIYALYKSRSFLGTSLVLGVFVLMNMDYALLNYEMGMFLFVIWLVCIYKKEDGYDG